MGFRGAIKKGGGFFTGDGKLISYEFTKRFKGEKKDGDKLYFVPTVQMDGSEKEIDQHIFFGKEFDTAFEISDDGQELSMEDGSPVKIPADLPFGLFMDTLFVAADKAGVDLNDELPDIEAGEPLNLTALVDRRFRFGQKVDEKGTASRGKRKADNGKEYDRTNTIVEALLGEGDSKSSGKASGSKGGKKGKDDDPETEALAVLKSVLGTGSVLRKNLSLPVSKALVKNARKDELKALILDEDQQDKWVDAEEIEIDKKGNVSVA
jgi:hypothetical protein